MSKKQLAKNEEEQAERLKGEITVVELGVNNLEALQTSSMPAVANAARLRVTQFKAELRILKSQLKQVGQNN